MTSGFLLPESKQSPARTHEVETAIRAYLDAAHNLRMAADVMPGLRNRNNVPTGPLPDLTPEEWTIVRSLQVLYGIDASHPRLDPDTVPSALDQPVFHPEASMKNAQQLRALAPKDTSLGAALEASADRKRKKSSELIADIVLQAISDLPSDDLFSSREALVAALEKRFASLRRNRQHQEEPIADLLQAAWGLDDAELETLLGVPDGWLAAWRIHEATMEDEQHSRLNALISLHEAIRLHVPPQRYSQWLRRKWRAEGFTRGRSPLEMLLSEGLDGLQRLGAHLRAQALG